MAQPTTVRPQPRRRTQSPAEKLLKILGVMLVTFIVTTSATVLVFGLMHRKPGQSLVKGAASGLMDVFAPAGLLFDKGSKCNILLVGEDVPIDQYQIVRNEDSRADTNMVISLDQYTKQVFVLSLPRDLRVVIPGVTGNGHKLNASHRHGGVPTLVQTINANLGITIHHYVKTNAHGFIELIDKVGGLDVDVERDMNYDDNWQDFHVHLKKGVQHLNGIQCQGYVRWRKNNNGQSDPLGDLGRVQRQQKVMKLLAAKILQPQMLPRLMGILKALRGYVETDLSDRQLGAMMSFMKDLSAQTIQSATLPCDYHKPFMYIKKQDAVNLLNTALGYTFDSTAITNAMDPKTTPPHVVTGHVAKPDDADTKSKEKGHRPPSHEDDGGATIEVDPGDDTPPAHNTRTKPDEPKTNVRVLPGKADDHPTPDQPKGNAGTKGGKTGDEPKEPKTPPKEPSPDRTKGGAAGTTKDGGTTR